MTKKAVMLGCVALLAAAGLRADFSYQQSSKMTGGALASAMKVVGVFSKTAREPIVTSVLVKGDRMAHLSADSAQIIDLGSETITSINFRNKTYSVMTFAQMAQALDQAARKARAESGGKTDMQFKASVKETGQTRQIAGLSTREVILLLEMQGTDTESGKKGSMTVTSDIWLARNVAGYSEVRDFYRKMSQKVAWMPGSSAFTQGRGDIAKALGDMYKESAKLEGAPVLQVVSIGGQGEGQPGQQPAAQKQEREGPSLGGALGRLGGLRRKKTEEPAEEQSAAGGTSASAPGVLMELTTEMTNFSAAPVDATKMQVPAGFKQVESEMLKGLR
jgi:hypothetical protein